jgi:hypothetical protein
MSDIPASVPWYKSAVLRGLIVIVISQGLRIIKDRYHIDLTLSGISADGIATWLLDIVSAVAVAYAAHGRISKPNPPITK